MSKLLLLFVAVLVLFWLLRRALMGRKSSGPPKDPPSGAGPASAELVSCAHCGVLLPQAEAIAAGADTASDGGRFFCSEEHRRLGPR